MVLATWVGAELLKNMQTLIETFHLDWKLLIAQLINFSLVFGVLYFFVFKNLFKTIGERNTKIEKGLKDAEVAVLKLEEAAQEKEAIIIAARKEANEIMKQAKELAEKKKAETVVAAKLEIGKVITEEKERMRQEKAVVLEEIRQESVDLIMSVAEKIIATKLDDNHDQEIIKKMIKQ